MSEELKKQLESLMEAPRHIGDGVYVSYDGYHVNIAVNDHRNHVVALDHHVQDALTDYISQIKAVLAEIKGGEG